MELLKKAHIISEKSKETLSLTLNKYKKYVIICLICFLTGRVIIFGNLSPFSLPLTLSVEAPALAVLFTILGIWSGKSITTYKYILINVFGVSLYCMLKWIFPKIERKKSVPVISFISTFTFGLIFTIFKDYVIYDILLVMFEATISFMSSFFIRKGVDTITTYKEKRFFETEETVTTLVIISLIICGIGNISLPFNTGLKNVVCITLVLLSLNAGNTGISAQVAAFMGLSAGIASDYTGVYVGLFSFSTLIASVFSKHGKLFSILGFILGNVIMNILLTFDYYMVISYQEILLSSFLYLVIPDSFFNKLFLNLITGTNDYDKASTIKKIATVKLDRLSDAFKKLSDTISATVLKNDKLNISNISTLLDAVSDKVCKKCALKFYCWQKDYDITIDALTKGAKAIEEKGTVTIDDFPDYFKGKCVKSKEVLNSLTNLYELYRLNYVWKKKMKENTKIYREQFLELSDIVIGLKDEIERNPYFDEILETEIASRLEREGSAIKNVSVIKDHNENIMVELILFPCQEKDRCYDYIKETLEEILDIPLYKFSGKCSYKECVLVFKESEAYRLDSSVKQYTKQGSEASGDSYSIKTLENSNRYIALCDGSGSGIKASEYSLSTLRLLEEFLKTGFSKSASIKLINSSLIFNSESDYFSTIDLSIVDLKNGELEIVKKGASPTYIKRANGEFEIIRDNTFPVGVTDSIKNNIKKLKLRENDIVIMISDGIFNCLNKEDWIIDALKAIKSDDENCISDLIMKIATSTENKDKDDMTVIVSKIKKV